MAAETFAGVAFVFCAICATAIGAKAALRNEVNAKSGIRMLASLSEWSEEAMLGRLLAYAISNVFFGHR